MCQAGLVDSRGTAVTGRVTAASLRVIPSCADDPKVLWVVCFMMFVFVRGRVLVCKISLLSPTCLCSAFCSLRLPTEYERNGRYEGSR